jgi:hypothetical protein
METEGVDVDKIVEINKKLASALYKITNVLH